MQLHSATPRSLALRALSQHLNTLSSRLNRGENIHDDCFTVNTKQEEINTQEDEELHKKFNEMKRLDQELEQLESRASALSLARVQQRVLLTSRVRESEIRNEQRRRVTRSEMGRDSFIQEEEQDLTVSLDQLSVAPSSLQGSFKRQTIVPSGNKSVMSNTSARQSSTASTSTFSVARRHDQFEQVFTSRPVLRKDFAKATIGGASTLALSNSFHGNGLSAVRKLVEARRFSEENLSKLQTKQSQVQLHIPTEAGKNASEAIKLWGRSNDEKVDHRILSVDEELRIDSIFKEGLKTSFRFRDI
jgi:hypothetical protein